MKTFLKKLSLIISVILTITTIILYIIASSMPKTVFNKYNIYTIGTGSIAVIFHLLFALLEDE